MWKSVDPEENRTPYTPPVHPPASPPRSKPRRSQPSTAPAPVRREVSSPLSLEPVELPEAPLEGKKIGHCTQCGHELRDSYLYCPGCGKELVRLDLISKNCCTCGSQFGPEDKFCGSCGRPKPA